MNRMSCIVSCIAALPLLVAGCGRQQEQSVAGAENFVPPAPRSPAPIPGQGHSTPLSAYVGHYPNDAVDGVSFFDRTEVANALVDVEADARIRRQIVGRDATTVPIFAVGDRIAAHGCEAHNCADRNWTLLIAGDGNREYAEICLHDAAVAADTSRWSTRAGSQTRPGDCPQS